MTLSLSQSSKNSKYNNYLRNKNTDSNQTEKKNQKRVKKPKHQAMNIVTILYPSTILKCQKRKKMMKKKTNMMNRSSAADKNQKTAQIILFQKIPRHRFLRPFWLRYDVIKDGTSLKASIYSNSNNMTMSYFGSILMS